MKLDVRHRRTAKKLVLPLVALAMMTAAMYLGSTPRPSAAVVSR
jgi:hypothetical protein